MLMTGISKIGYEIAQKGTEEVVKNASKIYEIIRGSYHPLNQEIIVTCPENIQKYSIAFEGSGGYVPKSIKFPNGKPLRVKLRPLRSGSDMSSAIQYLDDGFELLTSEMAKEDLFLLDIEYRISTGDFLDSLVERNRAKELPKDRENEYWMHAELKHPKVLSTKYGRLDLQDVDFTVDVGVSEDINMIIPPVFRTEMEAAVKLLDELNPHEKYVKGLQHLQARKSRSKGGNLISTLGNLQNLFFPQKFCRFIDVQRDFHYSDCIRGSSYYDNVPIPTWPKTMKIVSRTDLGLENFAAEGIVVYKREDFLEQVAKILGIEN